MKIVHLTPGTGSFHCGSCLRDLWLVKALRAQGHDVVIVPMYLPMVGEEDERGDTPIFFGGLNLYLRQKFALWRAMPQWVARWLDRPGILRWASSRDDHMTHPDDLGALTLSMVSGQAGHQRMELERMVDWLQAEGKPDVICASNALLLGVATALKEALGVPLACALQGEDSFLDGLHEPWSGRCWAALKDRARDVDRFLPVSRYHADLMTDRLGLRPECVHVVSNGLDVADMELRSELPDPPVIGYLARLCSTKGLSTLVDAFIRLKNTDRGRAVRLHIAGAATRANEPFVLAQRERLRQAGVDGDVTIATNITREEKLAFLRGLTVLSVPATYGESFGLYLLEAMACGVPVVQPDDAAFPEIINATGGGLLVPRDDVGALAEGLMRLIEDVALNRRLGGQGAASVRTHYTIDRAARNTADVLLDGMRSASSSPEAGR